MFLSVFVKHQASCPSSMTALESVLLLNHSERSSHPKKASVVTFRQQPPQVFYHLMSCVVDSNYNRIAIRRSGRSSQDLSGWPSGKTPVGPFAGSILLCHLDEVSGVRSVRTWCNTTGAFPEKNTQKTRSSDRFGCVELDRQTVPTLDPENQSS